MGMAMSEQGEPNPLREAVLRVQAERALAEAEHAWRHVSEAISERDEARQATLNRSSEAAALRAGVAIVLDTYRGDIPWQVEQDLRALLAETP